MAIKIESGIAIPVGAGRRGVTKYPFRDMNVGDSFFVATDNPKKTGNVIASCARPILGKGNFAIHSVEGGVRVWRLA